MSRAGEKIGKIDPVNTTAPTKPARSDSTSSDVWSQPMALRLRKPGWRDPRLIIGVILIALGVVVGSLVVSAASDTVTVYAAETALPAGTALTPESLTTRQVRIPDLEQTYLTPETADDAWWAEGPQIARSIGAGEVIPLAALTTEAKGELRPVSFTAQSGTETLEVGTIVDLWHVSDINSEDRPLELATGLEVSAISESSGPLSISGAIAVTVLVPVDELEDILDAKSSAGSVELVQHLRGGRP